MSRQSQVEWHKSVTSISMLTHFSLIPKQTTDIRNCKYHKQPSLIVATIRALLTTPSHRARSYTFSMVSKLMDGAKRKTKKCWILCVDSLMEIAKKVLVYTSLHEFKKKAFFNAFEMMTHGIFPLTLMIDKNPSSCVCWTLKLTNGVSWTLLALNSTGKINYSHSHVEITVTNYILLLHIQS